MNFFRSPATWLGGVITLREPSREGPGPIVGRVEPGGPVLPLWTEPDGSMFVIFPPVPYAMKLTAAQAKFVRSAEPTQGLTPEGLLETLRNPGVVDVLKQLVATRPDDLRTAARPLVAPLIDAFATPEYRPMIQAFLPQLGLG